MWIPDDLHAAWKATGLSLADLLRRGLEDPAEASRRVVREELGLLLDDFAAVTRRVVREELERHGIS